MVIKQCRCVLTQLGPIVTNNLFTKAVNGLVRNTSQSDLKGWVRSCLGPIVDSLGPIVKKKNLRSDSDFFLTVGPIRNGLLTVGPIPNLFLP